MPRAPGTNNSRVALMVRSGDGEKTGMTAGSRKKSEPITPRQRYRDLGAW
jgi:hypothetical protein